LYECSWVVGTEYTYNCGPVQMAPKDANYRPTLRLKVEQLGQKSITEQLYPVYDQFFIAWLRYQNSMAYMVERGYAVNMGMLMNLTDGKNKKMSWGDAIKLMKQTGFLPFMTSIPGNYQGGAISPLVPIEGGIGKRLEESIKTFEWCFWMIENITGLNPIALGSTPQRDVPVTTTQMSLQGTSNTLKPIIVAIMELKKNTATSLLRRIQVGLRNDSNIRASYTGVIGEADMEAIVAAERDLARYGLSLNFRPDYAFKEKLRKYIELCLQPGRDGIAPLSPDDALYFEERLDQGGDLMEIRQQIKYTIEKNRQREFAERQANIREQNEGLRRIEEQKTQGEAAMKQMDAELNAMRANIEVMNQIKLNRHKGNIDLFEELVKQGPGMWQQAMDAVSQMNDLSEADLPIILSRMNQSANASGVSPEQVFPPGGSEPLPEERTPATET